MDADAYAVATRRAGLVALGAGLAGILFGAALAAASHPWRAAAFALVPVGALQVAAGAVALLAPARAPPDPAAARLAEGARLERVAAQLATAKVLAFFLLAAGVALVALSRGRTDFVAGGAASVAEASVALVLALRAERRVTRRLARVRGPHVD